MFWVHGFTDISYSLLYLATADLQRFVRAPQTFTMSSKRLTWEIGITECKTLKLFHLLRTLATGSLTRRLDESTSHAGNWLLVAPYAASSSLTKNPLSAKFSSLGSGRSKTPDSSAICLSDTLPAFGQEWNCPAGVIPTRYLAVLLFVVGPGLSSSCLYENFHTVNYTWASLETSPEAFWHILKDGTLCWPLNNRFQHFCQDLRMFETVLSGTLNLYAVSLLLSPNLNFIRTINKWSSSVRDAYSFCTPHLIWPSNQMKRTDVNPVRNSK